MTSPADRRSPTAEPTTALVAGFEEYEIPDSVHLAAPFDGIPPVIDTVGGLERAAAAVAEGTGPAAIDTERASGFRYGQRAFLVQLRREGVGTVLIDPEATGSLAVLGEALSGVEWVLHAATQDLPSLRALDMHPDALFDTELGGRIAGLRRVGLAAETEELLGYTLAKEHSAVDWSKRPLPRNWLNYAALDVEMLIQLRWAMEELLREKGKLEWALQEFEAVRTAPAAPARQDPWRRTSGINTVKGRRQLTALRLLWEERERLAQHKDLAPGRLLPDAALVAAATAMPRTVPQLLATPGFHGRLATKEGPRWLRALSEARTTTELVPFTVKSDTLPPVKAWEAKRPEAAARLRTLKPAVAGLAEQHGLPTENLLTPEHLRRFCWQPPKSTSDLAVADRLRDLGARPWQIELTTPVVAEAWRELRARKRAARQAEHEEPRTVEDEDAPGA